MKSEVQRYRDEMVLALRLRDVSGERIGEVLAEIDSHTQATGERPHEAFGPPREYAAQVADALGSPSAGGWWPWIRRGLAESSWGERAGWLVAGVGGFVLGMGAIQLVLGQDGWLGLPAWLWTVIGAAMFAWPIVGLVTGVDRAADPVIDPRTGADVLGAPSRGRLLVMLLWPVAALIALASLLGWLTR